MVGWSRRASDGVVGRARLDAETGIKRVVEYLAGKPKHPAADADGLIADIMALLKRAGGTPVTYEDVQRIEEAERSRAAEAGVDELKFRSNAEMLDVLRR